MSTGVQTLPQGRPTTARRMAFARAALVIAVVIAVDQLTKHVVADGIADDHTIHIIPGLKLVHIENPGVAFGFLAGGGAIVYVVTSVALLSLIAYLALRPQRRLLWLPTGMLIGGAISNLIDRIANGAVTDFIKLPHWPAFNLADTSITLGVVVLLLVVEAGRGGSGDP